MDCLNDYIGLQGCRTVVPDSGLFLNDLAGIQLKQVDEIADDEQVNYVGVWAKVQKRALKIFEKDLRVAFAKKFKIKGVTQSINIGKLIDTTTTKLASAEYRGLTIEQNQATDVIVNSNFQVVFIQTIRIYLPGVETFDLKIYDLDTEEELYTQSITTTAAGWEVININNYYLSSRRLFIAYDCTGINSVKLDLSDHSLDCFGKCSSRVRGAYAGTGDPTDITVDTDNAHGLSVTFSTQCKYDVAVCNNKHLFAQAFLYLLGSEMLLEQIYSSRTNRWTMLDNKQAKALRTYYKAMYKGGIIEEERFDSELAGAVSLIDLDQYDCCIDCSGSITFQDPYI